MNELNETTTAIWIGLDVAKDTFAACVNLEHIAGQEPQIRRMKTQEFERTERGVEQCLAWADQRLEGAGRPAAALRVCMESTGRYSQEAARWLWKTRPSTQPAIVNPRFIKDYGGSLRLRNKTDSLDARVIACYGADRNPPAWEIPSKEYQALQELSRQRHALVKTCAAEKQRMQETTLNRTVRAIQSRHVEQLQAHIQTLEDEIERTIEQCAPLAEDVRVCDTIPGVGKVTIGVVFSELGDLRKYARARQVTACAGLTPRIVESGTSLRKPTRLAKTGNRRVRGALFLAAMGALRTKKPNKLSRFYAKLTKAGKTKMQALCAVMRKILVLMRAVVISGEKYDDSYDPRTT